RSGRDFVWRSQFRQDCCDRNAIRLEPWRQDEGFAERRLVFINTETGTVGCQFEKNAARLAEVDRFEPKAIDYRSRMRAVTQNLVAHFELVRLVTHSPGQVMHAACSPGSAWCIRRGAKI